MNNFTLVTLLQLKDVIEKENFSLELVLHFNFDLTI